jgi:zinc D-Ala-D-Ala carboxypeptidase
MPIVHRGTTYFTDAELRCKGSGQLRLAPGFAEALLDFRIAWKHPMHVTSCCRSKDHNAAQGGNPRSLHICDQPFYDTDGTCAIDIAVSLSEERAAFVALALKMGWWIGINKTFIHMDRRMDFGLAKKTGIFLY